MVNQNFWNNKKVLITGHTGFKGGWLSLFLHNLGANVTGYSMSPPTTPSFFNILKLDSKIKSVIGDINNLDNLKSIINDVKPEIIFHLAAQALVRESYKNPLLTYQTNVIGTLNVLEAVRFQPSVKVVVCVTTDKCYENKELDYPYKEEDPMGGYDPYSSSKGCAELAVASYRNSFFNTSDYGKKHNTSIATARAGNVIGGGDFAKDRLLPDIFRSIINNKELYIRNPNSIRPWQYVLEPLNGYMMLAEKMWNNPTDFCEAFNFGPELSDAISVIDIVKKINHDNIILDKRESPHESRFLKLNTNKAKNKLGWKPILNIDDALNFSKEWYVNYKDGKNMEDFTINQINKWSKIKKCQNVDFVKMN